MIVDAGHGEIVTLTFKETLKGTPYEGVEVRVRADPPSREFVAAARHLPKSPRNPRNVTVAHQVVRLFTHEALVSWNLVEDASGQPIPASYEGARMVPVGLLTVIVVAWIRACPVATTRS